MESEKRKEQRKRNYLKHKQERLEYAKQYRETHREQRNAYQREYMKQYRIDHPEKARGYRTEYYQNNKERYLSINKKWRSENKDKWTKACINSRKKKAEILRKQGQMFVFYPRTERENKMVSHLSRKWGISEYTSRQLLEANEWNIKKILGSEL